jgi:hypothetical protein
VIAYPRFTSKVSSLPPLPPSLPSYLPPEINIQLPQQPLPNVIHKAVDARNAGLDLLALREGGREGGRGGGGRVE